MYIKFSTLLYYCVSTLPCKLPHAKGLKCNRFSAVDCRWLWKEPAVYSRCSKWCPCTVMLFIDQRPCRRCSAESFPLYQLTRCLNSLMSRTGVLYSPSYVLFSLCLATLA